MRVSVMSDQEVDSRLEKAGGTTRTATISPAHTMLHTMLHNMLQEPPSRWIWGRSWQG